MNTRDAVDRLTGEARRDVVLRFVVTLVVEIVDGEIEVNTVVDSFGHAQVDHVEPGGSPGVIENETVKPVGADVAVTQ